MGTLRVDRPNELEGGAKEREVHAGRKTPVDLTAQAGADEETEAARARELAALDVHAATTQRSREIIAALAAHEASLEKARQTEGSDGLPAGEIPRDGFDAVSPTRSERFPSPPSLLDRASSAGQSSAPPAHTLARSQRTFPAALETAAPADARRGSAGLPSSKKPGLILAAVLAVALVAGGLVFRLYRARDVLPGPSVTPPAVPVAELPVPTAPQADPAPSPSPPAATPAPHEPPQAVEPTARSEPEQPHIVAAPPARNPPPSRSRHRDEPPVRPRIALSPPASPNLPPAASPAGIEPPHVAAADPPAPVRSPPPPLEPPPPPAPNPPPPATSRPSASAPAPPSATVRATAAVRAPSLPRVLVTGDSDRVTRVCQQVEAAAVSLAGVNAEFARNITAPLRRAARPNTPIYPTAMYYFIVREAAAKRDKSLAAANLAAAHANGRLTE
jgi:hypothetical protein